MARAQVPIQTIEGGVTTPLGFRAAGVACGIKRAPAPPTAPPLDLAILVADAPSPVAAMFTTNKAVAAPVTVSRDHLARSRGQARAVVVSTPTPYVSHEPRLISEITRSLAPSCRYSTASFYQS